MSVYILAFRFSLMNVLICAFIAAMLVGGDWIWRCYVGVFIGGCILDESVGDCKQDLTAAPLWIYNINLYATVPLVAVMTIVYLHHLTLADPFGFVHVLSLLGIEFEPEIRRSNLGLVIAATLGTGNFYALAGMTVGHELSHRTSRAARVACRALLASSLNTAFAIAHGQGHHGNVATYRDPGSARRGEYALFFAVRCTVGQHIEGFKIEANRLRRKGQAVLSWQNRAIRDQFYPASVLVAAFLIAGYRGVIGIILAALFGTLVQKLVDYAQHYGLVRADGAPIEDRHSWDCHRFLSNALQYNLPLHVHHHRSARTPFWNLRPTPGAPRLPCGYQTAALIALVPPIWCRIVDPLLADWDERMANSEERALVRTRGWQIEPNSWSIGLGWRTLGARSDARGWGRARWRRNPN